jgi:hypothetical protein
MVRRRAEPLGRPYALDRIRSVAKSELTGLLGFICSVSFVPSVSVAVPHRAVAQASCDAHPPAGTTSPQRAT